MLCLLQVPETDIDIYGHTNIRTKLSSENQKIKPILYSGTLCANCINEDNSNDKYDIKDMVDKALHELSLTEKVQYVQGKIEHVETEMVAGTMYYISFQATRIDCVEYKCPIAECFTKVVYKELANEMYVICVDCEMELTNVTSTVSAPIERS